MARKCDECRYQGYIYDAHTKHRFCDFIGCTGKARSLICKAGDGCACFEQKDENDRQSLLKPKLLPRELKERYQGKNDA